MRLVPALLLSGVALIVSGSEALAVNVSGTIATNTTWYQAQSPYVVTGTITVNAGVTLTIEPGVTVKFASIQGIYCYGTLSAVGTVANPIVFTSNQTTPTPGYWYGLWFGPLAGASRLEYATVAYAGAFSAGNLFVDNSSPAFDHVTSSYSSGAGFRIKSASATPTVTASSANNNSGYGLTLETSGGVDVRDTAFLNNGLYGVSADANTRLLGLTGLTLSGNSGGAGNAVYYRGGTITANETWRPGVDWYISSTPNVGSTSNASASLTIQPGVTVKFASQQGIYSYGTLTAVGSAASPIVFTSAQASPTPGYWYGLWFGPQAGSSRLEYATVAYAGYFAASNVIVDNSSPTFAQVTVRHSSGVGFRVKSSNATPTITGSTVNNNSGYGLTLETGAGADVRDTAFLNNSGYALSAEANTRLLGLTEVTLAGNSSGAGNAVYYRGGTITGNETWQSGVDWYVFSTPAVGTISNASPSLTIQPGATVRFASAQGIYAYGRLTAVGTAASPIVFTSAQATPTSGYWYGLWFGPQAGASQLAYATVAYAGHSSQANLLVAGSSPVFDHVTSSHASGHGLRVTSGSPTIRSSTLLGNSGGGVHNEAPANPVNATLNYWNAPSGPGGSGGGDGQAISSGVTFQPWLLAPATGAQFFSSAAVQNSTFDPTADIAFEANFATALTGAWSATVRDAAGTVVRTLTGSGATGAIAWDGRDDAGGALMQGTYNCDFGSIAGGGEVATTARARAFLDAHQNLTITSAAVGPPYFSPNGDGVKDAAVFSGFFNVPAASWEITVKNAALAIVRSVSGAGSSFGYAWDGRNDAAALQPDGPYTLHVYATAGLASASSSGVTVLDTTPPVADLSSPQSGQLLSNVLQSGNAVVPVVGTATDAHFSLWTLEYGSGTAPTYWTMLASEPTQATAFQFGSLYTLSLANGEYAVRLRTADLAGNVNAATRPITIGNFKVTQNVWELNVAAGAAVAYTSTVPFGLDESLVVKNAAGTIVRTLFNGPRAAGSVVDSWNGKNDTGGRLPDGPYFYVVTVTAGANTMVWDLSNDHPNWNDDAYYPSIAQYDPFNNQPMTFSYTFPFPTRTTIALSPLPASVGHIPANCDPPTHCIAHELYQEAGWHTVDWAGVDASGAYRGDMQMIAVVAERSSWANNAIVVFGTKPTVGNVRVTPPVYGPAVGQQQVSFDLGTYQGEAVDVDVSFLNQESLSTLRTIHLEDLAPGHIVTPWDGRADNGMWVAPGRYTVTVTATNALGNKVGGQILTTIQY